MKYWPFCSFTNISPTSLLNFSSDSIHELLPHGICLQHSSEVCSEEIVFLSFILWHFDWIYIYIYIWVKYIFHLYILLNMLHIWVKYPCLTCFLIIQQWNACWICFSIYRYKIKLFVLRLHLSCYAFKLLKPHIAANWYITIRMDL